MGVEGNAAGLKDVRVSSTRGVRVEPRNLFVRPSTRPLRPAQDDVQPGLPLRRHPHPQPFPPPGGREHHGM